MNIRDCQVKTISADKQEQRTYRVLDINDKGMLKWIAEQFMEVNNAQYAEIAFFNKVLVSVGTKP